MSKRSSAFSLRGSGSLRGKKVMVVGGAGFIGSHLCEAVLEEAPEKLVVVDNLFLGTLENLKDVLGDPRADFVRANANQYLELKEAWAWDKSFDVCFNLAVCPLGHSLEAPEHNVINNISIITNLCEYQKAGAIDRLIQFSSSEAYGSKAREVPMDEKHPLGPSTPYAASKAAGDLVALSYAATFGLNTAVLRPFNAYGERQNAGSYAGIIPLTIKRVLEGRELVIYGDGAQTRDYTYVRDVAEAACQMFRCFNAVKGKVVNMGSGRETAVIVLVMLINQLMEEMGFEQMKIRRDPARPGDVRRHIANIYLAEDLLGYDPSLATPLTRGLKDTVRWYVDKYGAKPKRRK
ncbi:MAG TPA: NAD-dependent epimerase/dehydratase family protein [Syntrophales bacterium]|nr:NAD-dependent epimerase/dehydratase family protein [Syntrophales bacterium]